MLIISTGKLILVLILTGVAGYLAGNALWNKFLHGKIKI